MEVREREGVAPLRMTVQSAVPDRGVTIEGDAPQSLIQDPASRKNRQEVSKRVLDLVLGTICLVSALPVLAIVALVVWIDLRGPVIFRQKRVGRYGEPFYVYKIRTMRHRGEEEGLCDCSRTVDGIVRKEANDPRVTRVGRFLRKYSVDELPQFFNVLKGEMSLVGPRPLVWGEVDMSDPRHRRRLEVLPGITCLWQVSGRSKIDREGHIRLDLEYLDRRSFWLDLWILVQTIPAVIRAEGAV